MREMIERVLMLILILIFDSNALSISFTDCGSDYFRKGAGKLKFFLIMNIVFNIIYETI